MFSRVTVRGSALALAGWSGLLALMLATAPRLPSWLAIGLVGGFWVGVMLGMIHARVVAQLPISMALDDAAAKARRQMVLSSSLGRWTVGLDVVVSVALLGCMLWLRSSEPIHVLTAYVAGRQAGQLAEALRAAREQGKAGGSPASGRPTSS